MCHISSLLKPNTCEMGQIRDFQAFSSEGMAWKLACWYIMTTFRTDLFIVMVYNFSWFRYNLTKWNRWNLGVLGIFLENSGNEWPQIWHADVSWSPSELTKFWWLNFGHCLLFSYFCCVHSLALCLSDWHLVAKGAASIRSLDLLVWSFIFAMIWYITPLNDNQMSGTALSLSMELEVLLRPGLILGLRPA